MKKILLIIGILSLLFITSCTPKPEGNVCCKIFGYGVEMVEVNIQYEWTTKDKCTIPEGFVGGGKEIVKDINCY